MIFCSTLHHLQHPLQPATLSTGSWLQAVHKGYEDKFASCPEAADAVMLFKNFLVG
jgi:hypothetical protein